jgi:N-acyl-D-amino-acid deacylase
MFKRVFLSALVLTVFATVMVAARSMQAQTAPFDLLIRQARIYDGTGNPWFVGDVAVKDGRIVRIGDLAGAKATRVVDGRGKYLAPGFIDLHSHSDRALGDAELRHSPNMVAQGITLSVVNQDGRSPWPIRDQKALYEKGGMGTNVAVLVGHGAIRNRVMGNRANGPASDGDIAAMQALVEEGMKDGAYGVSTGLEYVPGRFSEPREVVEITRPVKKYGGFYISHERSEGRDPMWHVASDPTPYVDLIEAVKETINIGRETGVPVVASHLKAKGADFWGASQVATRLIHEARAEGIEVYADQYPYDTSGSDGTTVVIPLWALNPPGAAIGGQLGEGGGRSGANVKATLAARLKDPADAAKIRRDIQHEILRRGGADRVVIYDFPDKKYVEKSLAWVAKELGITPVEAAIWVQMNGFDRAGGARMRGYSLSEIDLEHIMQQDFTATCTDGDTVAFGRGVPHARFYGTMPRKIRRYAMDRKVISVPFAIRSMTGLPAQIMRLRDRGYIREGYWADLVIFDESIADHATFTEPHQYPSGIPYVFVNGVAVIDEGKGTKALPGRVVRPN